MSRRQLSAVVLTLVCLIVGPLLELKAGDCDAPLKGGVFDIINLDSKKSLASNYIDWLKTADLKEAKSASEQGVDIDLGPFGKFGRDTSEESWNQSKSYRESLTEEKLSEESAFKYFSKIANKDILNAWLACKNLESKALGLSEDFAVIPGEPEVLITIHWRGTNQDPIILTGLEGLNVSSASFADQGVNERTVQSGADYSFRLTRTDRKTDTYVVVSHNKALRSLDIRIPADPSEKPQVPPKPIPPPPVRVDLPGVTGSRRPGQPTRAEIPKGSHLTSITVNWSPWIMGVEVGASDGSSHLHGLA